LFGALGIVKKSDAEPVLVWAVSAPLSLIFVSVLAFRGHVQISLLFCKQAQFLEWFFDLLVEIARF